MAYAVAQRTQEFGVRLAVGAQPRDSARLVLGQAVRLAVAGTAIGLGAALAATRAVAGLLIGIARTDPYTDAAVTPALIIVTVVTCVLPRRGRGVPPTRSRAVSRFATRTSST